MGLGRECEQNMTECGRGIGTRMNNWEWERVAMKNTFTFVSSLNVLATFT